MDSIHGHASVGQLAMTYISSLQTLNTVKKTYQKQWMIGIDGKKESGNFMPISTDGSNRSVWKLFILDRNTWYYITKLFVLRIVTWSSKCLIKIIIISYSKSYNCVQTNGYYWIELISWNHIIVYRLVLDKNTWNSTIVQIICFW